MIFMFYTWCFDASRHHGMCKAVAACNSPYGCWNDDANVCTVVL
jgi:hypothetical protein